jgi:hypothetical protein
MAFDSPLNLTGHSASAVLGAVAAPASWYLRLFRVVKSFILVMIGGGPMRTSKVLSVSLPAELLSRAEGLGAGLPPDRRATANTPKNIG